jgi:hypothetical protein
MIGFRVGFLEVISETDKRLRRYVLWDCKCQCGKHILVTSGALKAGDKKSCGCKTKAETSGTHGLYGTKTHNSWRTMRDRCLSPTHKSYEHYKDVPVDARWVGSFEAFYADMGERPNGTTLDRIENSLGYTKNNCRWANAMIQNQNKVPRHRNKHNGLTGVSQSGTKWRARLTFNGVIHRLNGFDTAIAANAAYNALGVSLAGEHWVYK